MTVIFIQNTIIYYDNAQFYHASLDSALVTNYTRAERLNDNNTDISLSSDKLKWPSGKAWTDRDSLAAVKIPAW